jgi:hypothetical protein
MGDDILGTTVLDQVPEYRSSISGGRFIVGSHDMQPAGLQSLNWNFRGADGELDYKSFFNIRMSLRTGYVRFADP